MKESSKLNKEFFNKLASSWDQYNTKNPEFLIDKLDIKEGMKVIDLGSGTGVITKLLYNKTKTPITSIDVSDKMLEIQRKKIKPNEARILNMDFYDFNETGYDYIVIYNAYPHFMDVEELKNKFFNVLKEKGRFAIIHSLSRVELEAHHSSARCIVISRHLKEVNEEASLYKDKFNIIRAYEDDKSYIIIGEKE